MYGVHRDLYRPRCGGIYGKEAEEVKKYELTSETKVFLGKTLYRIKALVQFGNVNAGDLGGWIEKEENLSQSGNAWVYGDASVYGNAWVSGNARVYGNASVYGNARVYGDARVYGNAWVYGDARVSGNAWVYGDARVSGNAEVSGNARVSGDARVYGDARVSGNAWVYGNAEVCKIGAVFWIGAIGSRNRTTTFFRCKDGKIYVSCGCFLGDLEEFSDKVKQTHGDNEHGRVYMLAIEMAKARIVEEKNEVH